MPDARIQTGNKYEYLFILRHLLLCCTYISGYRQNLEMQAISWAERDVHRLVPPVFDTRKSLLYYAERIIFVLIWQHYLP
jgi:hypothetical protein